MPTSEALLDLHGVGQRSTSYRFDLLDNLERPIGQIHPARADQTPTISHDSSRTIARDMANVNLTPVDRAAVNPLSDRIRPVMLLEDGSEYQLGIFLFADASNPRYSWGQTLTGNLVDKGLILDQAMDHTVSVVAGADPRSVVIGLLDEVGLASIVDGSSTVVGAPMAWPAGTSRAQVIVDLGKNVGWTGPWFDHLGICRIHRPVDPDATEPAVRCTPYAASMVTTHDLLHAVNRTIAISSDSTNQAFVGVYDEPAGSPHSFYARGFHIVAVHNVQGIGSQAQINEAARTQALAQRITTQVEHASYSGPPDPRHDGHTVVEVLDERWLEQSWSLPLSPDGPMTHTLLRVLHG